MTVTATAAAVTVTAAAAAAAAAAGATTVAAEREPREAPRRRREPQAFTAAQMAAATGGFRDPIDEGAFGAVYRGRLADGRAVAIKVLKPKFAKAKKAVKKGAEQWSGAGGFRKELEVLGKYRHRNIVELLGSCLGGSGKAAKQCLVFEWMAGGSLNKRLDPASGAPPLSAQERFDVASDVARGLEYLHVDADPPIIHQDVKSDNILLCQIEGRWLAKVADFGTARYAPKLLKETHHSTRNVIGTTPYMPPEYMQMGQVSEKTDTYAFGVVLCELLTGLPPADYDAGVTLGNKMYRPLLADAERAGRRG